MFYYCPIMFSTCTFHQIYSLHVVNNLGAEQLNLESPSGTSDPPHAIFLPCDEDHIIDLVKSVGGESMSVSLGQVVSTLLTGSSLSWKKFDPHKQGKVQLKAPEERRLLKYLLGLSSTQLADLNESMFQAIIEAWQNDTYDPAADTAHHIGTASGGTWRLEKIEASNFGGLTLFNEEPFSLSVNGKNWCLEGQNGSGKTSLTGAILWGLTGKRVQENEGPIEYKGEREPVYDPSGAKIGKWCPLISYPEKIAQLALPAEAWVRLTFQNEAGDQAIAFRKIVSPPIGDADIDPEIDARLTASPQMIETGILMPARMMKISFGSDSKSLYEAVKLLTGLEQLALVADVSSKLTNRNMAFLKYGKVAGMETLKASYDACKVRVSELSKQLEFDISGLKNLEDDEHPENLEAASKVASQKAAELLETLKADIADTLDTKDQKDRDKIRKAVATGRALVEVGAKDIALFATWQALSVSSAPEGLDKYRLAIVGAKESLIEAIKWHKKQKEDEKLRLKAVAAQYIGETKKDDLDCPLCDRPLKDGPHDHLADELYDIQESAAQAERKIEDACRAIEALLNAAIPEKLRNQTATIEAMRPADDFTRMVLEKFSNSDPFSTVLTGFAAAIKTAVDGIKAKLPVFEYMPYEDVADDVNAAIRKCHLLIHNSQRTVALIEWWSANRQVFADAWGELRGKKSDNDTYPADSMIGRLEKLDSALETALPYDELDKNLLLASIAAKKWQNINKGQKIREDIAESAEQFKELRHLVGSETAQSISNLSDKIEKTLKRIHLKERLSYEETFIEKKAVNVLGSFTPGMKIDATLVANTSWLRAILWAFILSLREETLEAADSNSFPLMVMDDPQLTFDPRNMRKWTQEMVNLANRDAVDKQGMQLFLTTHGRQFYKCVVDQSQLSGERGFIARANEATGAVTIVNETVLENEYKTAVDANSDSLARKYIGAVRIHAEDLLKLILRGEDPTIPDKSLGKLRVVLKKLIDDKIQPYTNDAFVKLAKEIENNGTALQIMDDLHHKDDETYGVAQAHTVRQYWYDKLGPKISDAFQVYANFETFQGDPKLFSSQTSVIPFPEARDALMRKLTLHETGVAAAAKSDGRAGDGLVKMDDFPEEGTIKLVHHDAYQLTANMLDPIAEIGDTLIVSNAAEIHERNLVVAAIGSRLVARRYNAPEDHPGAVVLTGQSVDPYSIPKPIIITRSGVKMKKVVGTIFSASHTPMVQGEENEVRALENFSVAEKLLDGAKLFLVKGRSAEPIAIEGQYIMTRSIPYGPEALKRLDNHLVVAIDQNNGRYFKRLRVQQKIVVLESLNPERLSPSEILSLEEGGDFPQLTGLLEVIGVLFEKPN